MKGDTGVRVSMLIGGLLIAVMAMGTISDVTLNIFSSTARNANVQEASDLKQKINEVCKEGEGEVTLGLDQGYRFKLPGESSIEVQKNEGSDDSPDWKTLRTLTTNCETNQITLDGSSGGVNVVVNGGEPVQVTEGG